jgi:putative hemolysin
MAEENSTEKQEKIIPGKNNLLDVDKVIAAKSPVLHKLLPGFVIRYFERLVHQKELNYYLITYGHLVGVDFIDAVLKDMNTSLELIGLENIPKIEKCLVASNHPLGGLDGLALMLAVSKVRRDILFPVNDILLNIKNLEVLFIPINKLGSNTQNIQILNDTFASGKLICYFPFGLVSRKKNGKIMDLEWKTTFLTKARKFERDIVPTYISGRNTDFFYNLANFRKKFKIKANLEMLFLPDEMIKQKKQTITITFGKPVPYQFFDKRHTMAEWAELMRQYVYKLGEGEKMTFEEWIELK